jgi:ATP-dependent protease ClpP protease subunit
MLGASESLVLSNILKCSPVPIYTTLIGPVGLGAAFILAGGTQGKRAAFPNSRISFKILNFVDLAVQNYSSILKNLRDKRKLVDKFLSVCAKSTSYSEHELLYFMEFMESEPILLPSEAINFGIIDHVVNIREENENRILDTLNTFSHPTYTYEQSRDYLF